MIEWRDMPAFSGSVPVNDIEPRVSGHQAVPCLISDIRDALSKAGVDPDAPGLDDLKPVDHFHTGGAPATEALLKQLDITARTRVLDIGCGIGGVARLVAQKAGAHVTGLDVSAEFTQTADTLSRMTGLSDKTTFHTGDALAMAVDDESFDLALMFHVGMTIEDKNRLFAEVARVLAPGGTFALFDVMRTSQRALTFPLPWAETRETAFVDRPWVYRNAARDAGLDWVGTRDRTEPAKAAFNRAFETNRRIGAPPPVGPHLLMRGKAETKVSHYLSHIYACDIAPVEMIFRKPA